MKKTSIALKLFTCFCCIIALFAPLNSTAETPPAFYPTWKLLKQEDKIQYLAGYMHAWQDANRTLGIANEYINQKPEQAADSINKLQKIYNFSDLRPDTLAREIDAYFADSNLQANTLSQAITAARARLR